MSLTSLWAWRKKQKSLLVLEALSIQLRIPTSEASKRVEERSQMIAAAYIMRWLDGKGIRHCRLCPSQQTLRKIAEWFYCPSHSEPRVIAVAPEVNNV